MKIWWLSRMLLNRYKHIVGICLIVLKMNAQTKQIHMLIQLMHQRNSWSNCYIWYIIYTENIIWKFLLVFHIYLQRLLVNVENVPPHIRLAIANRCCYYIWVRKKPFQSNQIGYLNAETIYSPWHIWSHVKEQHDWRRRYNGFEIDIGFKYCHTNNQNQICDYDGLVNYISIISV